MMKNVCLSLLALVLAVSCNEPVTEKAEPAAAPAPASSPISVTEPMPYPATVAGHWSMGDPEKIRIVLQMYKNMVRNNDYSLAGQHIADTIMSVNFENKHNNWSRDEFIKNVKNFRSQFTSINEEFLMYHCLHDDSLNMDVVSLWLKEKVVRTNGKPDSTVYQENWFFNADGKIFRRGSYARYGY